MAKSPQKRLDSFNLKPGSVLANKYEVISFLGSGWESEVYRVRERGTRVDRAAKIFFPQHNQGNRATKFYARKLHKLRHCPILIQYHTQERIVYKWMPVTFLISDYVEGKLLSAFLKEQRGNRLTPFEGLHLLHVLALGVEIIHRAREYHGDIHDDNVIVNRCGLTFDVKLVDFYNWGAPSAENIREDVYDLIRILYDALGGKKHYAKQPQVIKEICCGLKRGLITQKFRTAGHLRVHLETLSWR
jgi:tRNA A-37 threonylcarbamoyl transferase component Bud32